MTHHVEAIFVDYDADMVFMWICANFFLKYMIPHKPME